MTETKNANSTALNGRAGVKKRTKGDVEKAGKEVRRSRLGDRTDRTRWRLLDEEGRQSWRYLEDDEAVQAWPQSDADRWYLGLPMDLAPLPPPKNPLDAVRNGLAFFERLQLPPGNWGCEYGGPMFLMPCQVIVMAATKTPIPWAWRTEIKNYLFARAHPGDGGWGLHIEGESTVLGTSLNYTVLRLVGVEADDPVMVRARATLHRLGGAARAPHWAKFFLAMLGVAKWDIVNPVPPELWLLPDWVPFAPWRWWIHIRQVFLPMGYIYSKRWSAEETDVIRELRQELYVQPYDELDWVAHRSDTAPVDAYYPKTWVINLANWLIVNLWEPYLRTDWIKERAERWTTELVDMESENTHYLGLAPVSGPLNLLVYYIRDGPDAETVQRARAGLADNWWLNNEGMMVNGTNGVQCWDTAFAIQAVMDAGLEQDPRWRPMLVRALKFLEDQQMRDNVKDQAKCYRQQRKGGWAFSNKWQGYAVSDCISESLKSVILLQKTPGYPQLIDDQRIFDAIDTLLTYQNQDTGGCASYEPRRGSEYMELLNVAEIFGRIMVEYDYPECTTATVTALSLFNKHWPDYRADDIRRFVNRAVGWIKTAQYPHGGWYGSWAVCFTYATMFALESLSMIGETYENSRHAKKGCDFLISKQREDGGWSESYRGCEKLEYIEHPSGSQVVMTAWALIGLMNARYPDVEPLRRGVKLIMSRQQANGEWLQEAVEGVFNNSCVISYPNYKFTFTIKALGMFAQRYPNETVI